MTRTDRTSAFTLAELLVVLGIAAILVTGLWDLLIGGNRSFEESTAAGAAARSATLAIERVRKDLAHLAIVRPTPPLTTQPRPVRVGPGSELAIDVTDTSDARAADPTSIRVSTVTYRFVPSGLPGEGFYRNGQRLSGIVLERFEARLVHDTHLSKAPFLSLVVVGADASHRRIFVSRDLVYLRQLDLLRLYPHTVPNCVPSLVPEDEPAAPVS